MTETTTEPGTALATIQHTSPELDRVARLGMWLAAAESKSTDPKAKGMAAALRIAYAESIGLPAHAASEVHVINGNLAVSAKLKRALAKGYGVTVDKVDATDTACTAVVYENGRELGRSTWTIERAKARGLLDRPNWKTMPDRMLWARASSEALDDFAPWVSVGVMALEATQDAEYEVLDPDEVPFGDGD